MTSERPIDIPSSSFMTAPSPRHGLSHMGICGQPLVHQGPYTVAQAGLGTTELLRAVYIKPAFGAWEPLGGKLSTPSCALQLKTTPDSPATVCRSGMTQ